MPKRKTSKSTKGSKSKQTEADAILGKISGDFLECTICLEPFNNPKVLPCLHTFCEGCLKKFVAQDKVKNKFQCPTCRIETILPKGGVASFKNNFFVQSLSDTVQAQKSLVSKNDNKVQCDNCEEEGASHGCVVCEEFLCDECACAHRRGKRTRSHEVIGVAELKEQLITKTGLLKSRSLPDCPKHEDEKMKFYCETCKCAICRDCTVLQHKNHQYGYLADAVGAVREEIKNKLKAARQKITQYHDKASAVAKKQAELDTRSKNAKEDINSVAKEEIKYLTGLVKRKQTELNEKLACFTAARSKQLSATADIIERALGCLSSTVDFSQKVVEHGSDFDVMNVYSEVMSLFESLLEGPTPDIPDDISYVMFEPKVERKGKVGVLGNIVDKVQDDEMEEKEESRPETTFRFTVDDFTKLNGQKISPSVFIRNLPWTILTRPDYSSNNKSLAVYLQCEANSKSLWSCRASAELRLISQKTGVQTCQQNIQHVFYNKENSWGLPQFMPWHEVCDPQKGYIKDDKIILEAYVKADPPCGEKEIVGESDDEDMLEEEKEEELQAEASLRFTVDNFSTVTGSKLSPAVFIHNLPWKIEIKPVHDAKGKTLEVRLICDVDVNSFWSCRALVELQLIPQKIGVQAITMRFSQIYHSKGHNWGYPQFMPWHEVCDPQKGYIKDDKIILEAYVKADPPRGMKELILENILSEEVLEEEVEDEEDEEQLQTEATFRFTVQNFSKVMETKLSPAVFIRNLPWKIMAKPNNNTQPPNYKSLAVYLQCDADSNSVWSCRAFAQLRLIPQKIGVEIHSMALQHVFYKNANNLGFPQFMPWHEVCDPQKGYIKDDKIILEAYVKADAPCILA